MTLQMAVIQLIYFAAGLGLSWCAGQVAELSRGGSPWDDLL